MTPLPPKVDEDEPHFARCDVALDFAQGCQMEFRFHTLVWPVEGALPPWLRPGDPAYGNWTAEEKRQIIVDHVTEAVTHYKAVLHVKSAECQGVLINKELTYWVTHLVS